MPVRLQNNQLDIRVFLQPRASSDKIVGRHGDEIKIAVTAAPVEGQANAHLQKFLAKQCKVAKGQVSIEKGQLSRHKLVRVEKPKAIPAELSLHLAPMSP